MRFLQHYLIVRQSPPIYGLVLFSLDIIVLCFPWIATVRYDYKICPPDLVSTMVAMAGTFQFVIGE